MNKKILIWGMIAFVVFFVAFRPAAAAAVISHLGEIAASIFEGVGRFFGSLTE